MITAYTDGACKGNGKDDGGRGGFGAYIEFSDGTTLSVWGGEDNTTNNRMELLGAITALEKTPNDVPLTLYTDSSYVQKGITEWISGWKQRRWKQVKSVDLWQKLDSLSQNRTINWQWIKGHAGHHGNEQADALANLGVTQPAGEKYTHPTSLKLPTHPPMTDTPIATDDTVKQAAATPKIHQRYDHQNPDYNGDTSQANDSFWTVIPNPTNRGKPERQLIMDTETTGFEDKKGDRIVEIGMIEMIGRKFTGQQVHIYLNPDMQMSEEVMKVHGISNEFLQDKPRFSDIAAWLYEYVQGAELIAHNAKFDMRFLQMEFEKAGFADFEHTVSSIDTLEIARSLYGAQKNSLDALVRRLDVGKRDRTFHGALLDSEILAEVYLKMTSGQIALAVDDDNEITDIQQGDGIFDLSSLATCLNKSISDFQADDDWRKAVFQKT